LISIQFLKGHRPTIPIPIGRRVFHARLLGLWCHDAKPICGALAESCSPDFGQVFSCRDFGVQHIRTSENQYRRQTGTGTKRIAREQLGRKTARRSFVRIQRSNGSFPCPRPNSTCPETGAKRCGGSRGSSTTASPTETAVSRRSSPRISLTVWDLLLCAKHLYRRRQNCGAWAAIFRRRAGPARPRPAGQSPKVPVIVPLRAE
jgi:hypothetical protein